MNQEISNVKKSMQEWESAGLGDEPLWEWWAECPTEIEVTPKMVLRVFDAHSEREKRLIGLCESAKSICMGDFEPSDLDDWVTDYNEILRKFQLASVAVPE